MGGTLKKQKKNFRIGAKNVFKTALKWYLYNNTLCVRIVHNFTLADGAGEEVVYEGGSLIMEMV